MRNLYAIRPKGFNIGNDAIFIGISHFIRKSLNRGFNFISLPATTKYESQRTGGLNAKTVYEINRNGHGVIIGGGNLYENNELDIDEVALKALDKPSMIFSVSRGRIYNNSLTLVDRTNVMPDSKIKALHSKVDISLSRDVATYNHLNKIGCNNILSGCPTLFMNEIPQHLVPMLGEEKTDALISLRSPMIMSIPINMQYKVRDSILKILDVLKNKCYKNIKFLCHDHRDIEFANSFTELSYFYTDDIYTYLTILRNTKLNITFRLHSFLPSLAFDIPTIKISYDERALSLVETIGLDEWNVNYVLDDVVKEVEYRINNLDELKVMKNNLKKDRWAELKHIIEDSTNEFAKLIN